MIRENMKRQMANEKLQLRMVGERARLLKPFKMVEL